MSPASRHQCLIYDGSPSRQLPAIASAMCQMLNQNHRCLYLNSPPVVAGLKSCLAASGIDVAHEIKTGKLVLSSERNYLLGGWQFDVDCMLDSLQRSLTQALADGYQGLWASGDMAWEFGPEKDLSKLVEYEWRLERFLHENPQMGGICQYHSDILPRDILRKGLLTHPQLFINETLTIMNPHYLQPESFTQAATADPELDRLIDRLFEEQAIN